MLENSLLANTLIVKQFLDPENYSENFKELALAHVSMFFRSEPSWQIVEPLNEIGWRFRKKHILLKNSDMSNSKFLLTWVLF
jgi:PX domain-containing protein kinase-like protein